MIKRKTFFFKRIEILLFSIFFSSTLAFPQVLKVTYEELNTPLFPQNFGKIKLAILGFTKSDANNNIESRLYEKLKLSSNILSLFEITSYQSLTELKSDLGLNELNPDNEKFRKKVRESLDVEYLIYGIIDDSGNEIELYIDEIQASQIPFQMKFMNSKYSTAVDDILALLSRGVQPVYTPIGSLTINTSPDNCNVLIDSIETDILKDIELAYGEYNIKIDKVGYNSLEDTFSINNPDTILNYQLEKLIGTLKVISTPSDANNELFLNDSLLGGWSGNSPKEFPVGKYNLRLKLEGYKDSVVQVEIKENEQLKLEISLNKLFDSGRLEITVKPESVTDAEVFLNDELKGNAPLNLTLFTGKYNLKTKKDGYNEWIKNNIIIKKNDTIKVNVDLIKMSNPELIKHNKTWNWVTTGLAVIGSVVSGYFYTESLSNHDKYLISTSESDALHFKTQTDKFEKNFWISASITAGFSIVSLILWIVN